MYNPNFVPLKKKKGNLYKEDDQIHKPVIDQVKLSIVTPPDELPLPLVVAVPQVLVLLHYGEVGGYHSISTRPDKLEAFFCIRVEVVEENASNTTRDIPVLDSEVVITPSLELAVVHGVVLIAGSLEGRVKVLSILFIQVVRSQVTSSSKPPSGLPR